MTRSIPDADAYLWVGICTCDHLDSEHGFGECRLCDCEAGWEE